MYFNFSVIKLNLDIKNNIMSFGNILGLIWRLSRYGSGRPGIDSNDEHYMPSCMSKYRFFGVRISNLMSKFWLDSLDQAVQVQTPMTNIICLPCMSKYRFMRIRISNHKNLVEQLGSCSRRSSSRSGGRSLKIFFMYFNLFVIKLNLQY